jgi:hypothetical protein
MTRAKAHIKEITDAEEYGFGTVFRMKHPKSRVQGRGQLGVIIAVDGGGWSGRTLVVKFEDCPNATYRLSPDEIEVIRK